MGVLSQDCTACNGVGFKKPGYGFQPGIGGPGMGGMYGPDVGAPMYGTHGPAPYGGYGAGPHYGGFGPGPHYGGYGVGPHY